MNQSNVFYDSKSDYDYDQLNETIYLEEIFNTLEKVWPDYYEYEFHIISTHDISKIPTGSFSNHPRKILFWLSEEQGFLPAKIVLDSFIMIFKTSYNEVFKTVKNVRGLPLGVTKYIPAQTILPINTRKTPVFFSGQMSMCRKDFYYQLLFGRFSKLVYNNVTIRFWDYIYRRFLIKYGKKHFGDILYPGSYVNFTNGFQQGLSPLAYSQKLQDSKIVLSPKGFYNTECYRTYEALRQGCIVISETLPDVPFYSGSPIIEIKDWRAIRLLLQNLLKDEDLLESISQEGVLWYNEHLSGKGVAKYIIEEIVHGIEKINCC